MERRKLLIGFVQGIGVVTAGVLGIPALIFGIAPALERRKEWWQPVGPLASFPVGPVTRAVVPVPRGDEASALREKAVFVWRPTAAETVVYSRNCTDLSCPVNWDPGSEWFFCPCHGGIFDKEGNPRAGPPSRPLYRYANRIRDDILEIDLLSLPPMT